MKAAVRNRALLALSAVAVLVSCKLVESGYDRHRMSRLYPDTETKGQFVFEATIAPGKPADSKEAEDERLAWLEGWLDWGRHCRDGYRIVDRGPIDPAETNVYGHDLRYRVACVSPPGEPR